jgi:glutaminase
MASLERHYISTGHLLAPEMMQSLVQDTHRRSKSNSDGKNSQAYPARVPSELFGVCVVGTSGRIYGAGDVDYEFSIMSVSKPFLFALICETIGPEEARAKLGANATGLPFNSLAKIAANPLLPKEIQAQVDLGNITCVSNDQLRSVIEKTTATPRQVQEALRAYTEARLRALKIIGLLFMAGLPLLAVIRPTSSRTSVRERPQAMSQRG